MILMGNVNADINTSGWHLHEGIGDRTFPVQVKFKVGTVDIEFPYRPAVIVSLTHVDADQNANVRVIVNAANVTKESFTANFRTWADSKIYGLGISWIAIGAPS